MTEGILKQMAEERGFLNASKIEPAHIKRNENRVMLLIPADTYLQMDASGNLTLKSTTTGSTAFYQEGKSYQWEGMIYYAKEQAWAEIIEYHKRDLVGRYIKVLKHNLGGSTGRYTVGDYLKVLENPRNTLNVCHTVEHAGTLNLCGANSRIVKGDVELMPEGWTPSMLELGPTHDVNGVAWKSATVSKVLSDFPSEGVVWDPTDEFYDFISKKKEVRFEKPYKGIAWGHFSCWPVMQSSGKPVYTMKQLERFIPKTIPEHVKHYPLTPEESFFPKKWCIETNSQNAETLDAFLKEHKDEWHYYKKSWFIAGTGSYLHYPPVGGPAHSELKPQPGYTLITFEQFKKYVKNKHTHEDKQIINNNLILQEDDGSRPQPRPRESSALKVQRPNLTVRESGEIRATGVRCNKIQIKVASDHSSDTFRTRRG